MRRGAPSCVPWLTLLTLVAVFIPPPAYAPPIEVKPYKPFEYKPFDYKPFEYKSPERRPEASRELEQQEYDRRHDAELRGSRYLWRDKPPADADRRYRASTAILSQLPTTDVEYRTLFGANAIVSELVERELREVDASLPPDSRRAVNDATFETVLANIPAAYIVVLGHNAQGRFRFLDGSSRPLDALAKACRAAGRICIFFSCRSAQYVEGEGGIGVSRDLTFREALSHLKNLSEFLKALDMEAMTVSPAEVRALVLGTGRIGAAPRVQFIVTGKEDEGDQKEGGKGARERKEGRSARSPEDGNRIPHTGTVLRDKDALLVALVISAAQSPPAAMAAGPSSRPQRTPGVDVSTPTSLFQVGRQIICAIVCVPLLAAVSVGGVGIGLLILLVGPVWLMPAMLGDLPPGPGGFAALLSFGLGLTLLYFAWEPFWTFWFALMNPVDLLCSAWG